MADRPDVSIVIPNYEGRAILPRTLARLREALAAGAIRAEVIVADDASRDGSVEWLRAEHPEVRVVARERNGGFAEAVNSGAAQARADLLYLMNSDVLPHAGFLEPLVAALRSDRELFSAMSLNLDPGGRVGTPNQVAPRLERGMLRLRGLDLDAMHGSGRLARFGPVETLYGAGGSVLVRRAMFAELGGFSTAFSPYYYEDADLGWRAWRRGWRSILEPSSIVTHDHAAGSIATTRKPASVLVHRKRNRFLLLWRNCLDPALFRRGHLARLPLFLAGRALALDATTLRGFAAALRSRAAIRAHRAAERAATHLADRDLFERLESERERLRRG